MRDIVIYGRINSASISKQLIKHEITNLIMDYYVAFEIYHIFCQ